MTYHNWDGSENADVKTALKTYDQGLLWRTWIPWQMYRDGGNDTLTGGKLGNTIDGGRGTFDGGAGTDTMRGGTGNDTLSCHGFKRHNC